MSFAPRHLRPLAPADSHGWTIKQYEVTVDGGPIAADVRAAADAFLPKLLPAELAHPALSGLQADTPRFAFSVLHQGVDALWLNLYSWCYEAIVHCRVASAPLGEDPVFTEVNEPLVGCVWELPALVHERSAWVRHILRPPAPDPAGYLADLLPPGPVGDP